MSRAQLLLNSEKSSVNLTELNVSFLVTLTATDNQWSEKIEEIAQEIEVLRPPVTIRYERYECYGNATTDWRALRSWVIEKTCRHDGARPHEDISVLSLLFYTTYNFTSTKLSSINLNKDDFFSL